MATADSTRALDEVGRDLEAALRSSTVERHHPLGELTTYRVGGRAALFVEVVDAADLAVLAGVTAGRDIDSLVLGRGSNLLVADAGFAGLVIHLGDGFAEIDPRDDGVVVAGAAAPLPTVARRITAASLRGFEWAVGVPGSIGGAVRMNAGGHGSDMAASLRSARVLDLRTGGVEEVAAVDLELGYRRSAIQSHHVVVTAELVLRDGDATTGLDEISEIVRWRREHQPGGQNAGSVFTNPRDDSAGRLIDSCGLKGFRVGAAEISTKHANFIQADPEGSADDVAALMIATIEAVEASTGIRLHPETKLAGFDAEVLDALGLDTPTRERP